MTFNLRDTQAVEKILSAASSEQFDYKEDYSLSTPKHTLSITGSIRTLTILSISAQPANLYAELFNGWRIADATPLAFFHPRKNLVVIFRPDWVVQAHAGSLPEKELLVSKFGCFEELKAYLQ